MNTSGRTELLIGPEGTARLAAAHVAVLGLGGVGSNCLMSLARAGIGNFTLVDFDVVVESNVNRQAIAFQSTLGEPKCEVARRMVLDINPQTRIQTFREQLLPGDIEGFLARAEEMAPLSYVIDCIDTITTKLEVAELCAAHGIRQVAALGSGNKFHPELLRFADIYDTSVCPMCKAVRKAARKRGLVSMQVLFSTEEPVRIPADDAETRSERRNIGHLSYFPAIMGQLLASRVIRDLLGAG